MTERRLLIRFLATALLAVFAALGGASATPIRPDVQKLLSQPQDAPPQFVPARAGWNGPEMVKAQAPTNLLLETFGQAGSARAVRAALLAAAIPDPRAVAAIVVMIFALRGMRSARLRRTQQARPAPPSIELRPAA